MNASQVVAVTAVIGSLLAVAALYVTVRSVSRTNDAAQATQKEDIRKGAYADGVQSQAYLVSQLTAQAQDAYRDRDDARNRANEFERRYNDLRDQRDQRNRNDRTDRRDSQERRDREDRD